MPRTKFNDPKQTLLTQKQENFCLSVVELGDATAAYRKAFDAENMKPESVWTCASRLMDEVKVRSRIEELRKNAAESVELTLSKHLDDLKSLRDSALKAGQYGPAVTAEVNRGKAAGLYTEKLEHSNNPENPLNPVVSPTPPKLDLDSLSRSELETLRAIIVKGTKAHQC